MTTAAVKAAAITIKIFFFIDHPFVGVEFSIFNMQRTAPRVSRITEDSQVRSYIGAMLLRMKIEGLPVIDVDESEEITIAVRAHDLLEGNMADPERHPIAIALRRQNDVDDARVTKNETLVLRGKKWFRYDAPDKRLFKQLQKTLTTLD
jgi:hypothetical protein